MAEAITLKLRYQDSVNELKRELASVRDVQRWAARAVCTSTTSGWLTRVALRNLNLKCSMSAFVFMQDSDENISCAGYLV